MLINSITVLFNLFNINVTIYILIILSFKNNYKLANISKKL